jgi:hypothetical protein
MNRLRARRTRRFDDAFDAQITLGGRRSPDQVGFVGETHVERARVRLGIDGHRRDV